MYSKRSEVTSVLNLVIMDLFDELKIKKTDLVTQPAGEKNPKDLFLGNNEKLNKILKEKSSVRSKIVEVENQDEKKLNTAKTSLVGHEDIILKSISVEREVAELTLDAVKEDESEVFGTDEIYNYIDREKSSEDDNHKLFK